MAFDGLQIDSFLLRLAQSLRPNVMGEMRILALLLIAVSGHANETLVKETISQGVFDKAVVTESLPAISNQAAMAKRLFREHRADIITRLAIYTSLTDATSAENRRGVTDLSLQQWKTFHLSERKGAGPALEILRIGAFAAIRRFDGGNVTTYMISPYRNLTDNLLKLGSVYFVAVTAEEHRASWTGLPAGVLVNVFLKYNGKLKGMSDFPLKVAALG